MAHENYRFEDFKAENPKIPEATDRREALLLTMKGMIRSLQYLYGVAFESPAGNDLSSVKQHIQDELDAMQLAFNQAEISTAEFYDDGANSAMDLVLKHAELIEEHEAFDTKFCISK